MAKKISDMKQYVAELMANGAKPVFYAKTARISARPGIPGEKITTTLANGHQETVNVAKAGDMVATNPGGEQYVIKAETFKKKYEIDPDNPKVFRPKGGAQQFLQLNEDIDFVAPWGEDMHMKSGDFINVTDREKGDIYGIAKKEFFDTYGQCTPDGKLLPQVKTLPGIKYDARAGNMYEQIQKMLDIANKENSFVYESLNGTLLVVEPGMSVDDAMNLLDEIRSGKKKTIFYNSVLDYLASRDVKHVANIIEEITQDNDIVVSNIQGTVFRAFKGMNAEDVLNAFEAVKKIEELRFASQKLQKDQTSSMQMGQYLQNQNDNR